MDCFIGIDGGGTKTLLRAVDSQKNMLCEIMGGGTNIYSLGEEAVRINVDLLLRECLSKLPPNSIIKGICLGSAGVVGEENRKALHRMIRNIAHCDLSLIHIYLSAQNQPPQYQNAPYVSSEIASTTNETLYYQYKLKQAKDDDEILYYTAQMESYMFGYGIEVMKQAKIEEIAQDAVLNGEVLTADFMNKTTMDVLKQFYGPAVNVAESSKIYWAKIPHYYSDFYVFNYAMSYTATNMVVKDINAGKASRFLSFLKAGSSKDALELIKEMGIDMESETPYKTLYQDYRSYLEKERELLCKNGQQMSDDGSIQVVYKGNLINFENKPVSIDYVTLVDAEALLRQIGLPVSMENGLTASADGTELRFQEGQQNASVNGVNVPMQLAAQTVNNKLFVPIRFIADQLGLSISYNERTKTVVLK